MCRLGSNGWVAGLGDEQVAWVVQAVAMSNATLGKLFTHCASVAKQCKWYRPIGGGALQRER